MAPSSQMVVASLTSGMALASSALRTAGALNRDGDMDGHVNVVVLDLNLGDDVGLLRGDPGVGPHGSKDLLLDNSVSGGRASRDRCRGDGSHVGGSVRDDRGSQRAGL